MRSSSYFIVTLIVAVPFLISMIILYIFFLSTKGRGKSEVIYSRYKPHCGYKQVAGILKRTYHDVYDTVDFQCTGLILGENIVVTPVNLISNLTYNVSSGSEYWSKNQNLHRIIKRTPFGALMVYEVEPDFPKCIHEEKMFIAAKGSLEEKYEMKGWNEESRLKLQRIQRVVNPSRNVSCKFHGSILSFVETEIIFGMSSRTCDGSSAEMLDLAQFVPNLKPRYKRLFNIDIVE